MAQIDIGKIKPVFRGSYDNSTAYVLDDIVYYNGSSYVAKTSTTGNLPTDTTKWNLLAEGVSGIFDSSLSLGSAGQALKVNSGATALEFGSVDSSTFAQAPVITTSSASGSTTSSSKVWNGLSVDITPTSASNKILIYVQQQQRFHQGGGGTGDGGGFHNYLYRGDTNVTIGAMNSAISGWGGTQSQIWYQMYTFWVNSTSQIETDLMSYMFIDTPNTTNLCRYFTAVSNHAGSEHISWKIDGGTSLMYAIELKS